LSFWRRSRQFLSVVRLKPFDSATPDGRSNERHRRIALTAIASAAAKALSVLTLLISVPLTIHYLGTERYGLWMTISSIVLILGFADLGMGNGLLNAVSEANGKDDRELARTYVSSSFFLLSGLSILLALLFACVYPAIPWERVFNVSSPEATREAGPAMAVFVGCFLVSMPLGIVQRIQMGYQEGFVNSLWEGLGSLLGLAGALLVIHLRAGLPWLVLAMAGAPALAALANTVALFGFRRPWLWPSWNRATGSASRKIFRMGILFFALQASAAIAYSSDNIILAQVLGPDAVAQYSVAARIFSIAPMMLGMILAPLWPAYGESIIRGDIGWVKRTLVKSLSLALFVTGLPAVLLAIFGIQVVLLWVGPAVAPSFVLLLGLAIWSVMFAAGNAVAMFLNGASILRFQVICAVAMSAAAILVKVLLVQRIGLPGVIWGTIVSYAALIGLPFVVYVPKLLSAMEKNAELSASIVRLSRQE